MVIHLALQFFTDGFPQLADIAVRLPTNGSKPGGAVEPQREKIQDFLVFLTEIFDHAGDKWVGAQLVHLIGAVSYTHLYIRQLSYS